MDQWLNQREQPYNPVMENDQGIRFRYLKSWIERLEANCDNCKVHKESPVYKFLEDVYHIGVSFYLGNEIWQVCFSLLEHLPKKNIELTKQEQYLDEILVKQIHQSNYQSSINRTLIIDAWSTFEANLYELVREYFNEETKDYLCEMGIRETLSLLKLSKVNDLDIVKIRNRKKANEISKLPIPYLVQQVLKICHNYPGDQKVDSAFLGNLGRWRNMMHNGFINYGSELNFSCGKFDYVVSKNQSIKLLDQNGVEINHISGYPILLDELIEVWKRISSSIQKQSSSGLHPVV